jgi:hypothetical protein
MPEILFTRILDELQERMCGISTKQAPAYEKIHDWVVDLKTVIDINEKREGSEKKIVPLKEADNFFKEYGCTICDMGVNGMTMTDCPIIASPGAHVSLSTTECQKSGGEPIGAYHTHPFTLPIPSVSDINIHFREKHLIDFIGGKVGSRDVLVGYGSRDDSRIKYEMRQKINPFPGDVWDRAKGAVCFWTIPPALRKIGGTERVQVIPVYDETAQLREFDRQIEELKRFFDVLVRWC